MDGQCAEILFLRQNEGMDTMKSGNDLFAEFPPVSKEEWIKKIVKDLKDRVLDELDWQVSDQLTVSPFAHADDFPEPRPGSALASRARSPATS